MAGLLEGAVAYTSGAMEFVQDHGVEWRKRFISLVQESKLKIDIIDPTNKPGGLKSNIEENITYQKNLKKEGKWHELRDYVHLYRRYDLRYVDYSDFLVTNINLSVPQWGTANEIYVAESQHKPIFFICPEGIKNMPNWLFDLIDFDFFNVFESLELLTECLLGIDSGKIPMNHKWILTRKHIENARKF